MITYPILKKVEKLENINPDHLINCGDFIAHFAVTSYLNLEISMITVFENNDAKRNMIKETRANRKKVRDYTKLDIDNKKIIITYEDNLELFDSLVMSQTFNDGLFGYTHQIRSEN